MKFQNKIMFALLLLLCGGRSWAFTPPDYDKIRGEIYSKESEFYYPTLEKRYFEADTTLTLDHYHRLYYGFTFEPRYEPLKTNPYQDSLMVILSGNRGGEIISPELFRDVKRVGTKLLEANPFDINILNIITFVYQMEGNEEKAMEYSLKMQKIKQTIINSGSGTSKQSPWYVNNRSDQNSIIASLGGKITKTTYSDINTEYVSLFQRINGHRGFYFDISRTWSRPLPEKKKAPRRFELKGTNY